MLNESRRRAYLNAMQVVNWLPRTALPFAAPSRPELLAPLPPPVEPGIKQLSPASVAVAPAAVALNAKPVIEPPKVEVPRPSLASTRNNAVIDVAQAASAPIKAAFVAPPRFALQLLRAGRCLLLVELPTGEAFQSRDPAYLLLKDMLRAAGLRDSPRIIGEPVRWPLLVRGQLDQGPESARDFVQGFVSARLEDEPCACLWLIGLPSIRFAGEANAESYNRELQVEGLGSAWALPGLELLMDEPQRKADVWLAMRRLMTRWKTIE
ncbi:MULTISPECIES: energy transducer TonB [unclassified Pseudomonas]|uniref:energy transducer TonB n=1 Tax=unclassified Pseudomonas TaxID=196821 RepID=UPI002AC90D1D|nr:MULTISPECIES: energy transducer TonB [unclassified Pseudomonas]MEB0041239.1 energy transducer TonB [Pseudomonas sp. MH10]MEB0078328.1 energy transducer TonB [Pseudomonas sp. MH10out]MEB0092289.1 energy transducer TonB [Pseudomonas sp. CCI4.2]MEB0101782.1 energy transducer TonB [Pseudomonas sp. CCI3.2]MEB0123366.1 energy transducer TonB [Pseudomonas sp. CCI1.2]